MFSWTGTLYQYFKDGGICMWPLLACAIAGVAYIIERWMALNRATVNAEEFLTNFRSIMLKKKSVNEAIALCEETGGPISNIMKAGLSRFGDSEVEIERAMEIAAQHEIFRLEKGLSVLATVSNIAPLFGFLGTVTGMIAGFAALQRSGLSDPGAVAKGISEALITTAAGLFIALPVLTAYNWFTARVSKMILEMQTGSTILLETFAEMQKKR
jgi:biopolymer transport protein ExbB